MTRSRRVTAVTMSVTTALLALTTAACSTSSPTPSNDRTRSTVSAATKTGTGEVRHDLDPLTRRFTALGTPVSATWMSGTLGGDAPGPSTYWIDAVVRLSPDAASALRADSPAPTTETPDVEDGVRSALPTGKLLRSGSLDAAFAQGTFRAKAYLAADSDTVVLVALGQ